MSSRCAVLVAFVLAVFVAGCGDGEGEDSAGSSPVQYEPSNPYEGLDSDELYDAELALTRQGASCAELTLWYDAQPGDSNPAIARNFYAECDRLPPPVLSGELTERRSRARGRPRPRRRLLRPRRMSRARSTS